MRTPPTKSRKAKSQILSFRISNEVAVAMESLRKDMAVNTFSLADAAREFLVRCLKEKGKL